jgi:hypothetical protein
MNAFSELSYDPSADKGNQLSSIDNLTNFITETSRGKKKR